MRRPICLTKVPRCLQLKLFLLRLWASLSLSLIHLEALEEWRSSDSLFSFPLARNWTFLPSQAEKEREREREREISMYTNYRTQRGVLLSESNVTPTRGNRSERAPLVRGDGAESLVHRRCRKSRALVCIPLSEAGVRSLSYARLWNESNIHLHEILCERDQRAKAQAEKRSIRVMNDLFLHERHLTFGCSIAFGISTVGFHGILTHRVEWNSTTIVKTILTFRLNKFVFDKGNFCTCTGKCGTYKRDS